MTLRAARRDRGAMSHEKGRAAEDQVARDYERRGAVCLERRWRGAAGEMDLIFRMGEDVVFVEVKSSKSHARAAQLLSQRQIARLLATAEEFLGTQPEGSLTPMRMDVALVNGEGRIAIVENALADG
ncbi:hypothetical protein E4Z66_15595 [Aliishimia ponticola]|uniref:UPF0102 protein E4Z66_15595 n=1 Tax=Aliishimia ponticola TaxID=2499833 RepID=A0A4S4N7U5_9RHOB|nr:YraN family protein [Aliishimia ponticola]THH35246.1 hypothetical protein E4Z66_15595 [Aliishimia ponticola]